MSLVAADNDSSSSASASLQLDDIFCIPQSPEEDDLVVARARNSVTRTYGVRSFKQHSAYDTLMVAPPSAAPKRLKSQSKSARQKSDEKPPKRSSAKRQKQPTPKEAQELTRLKQFVTELEEAFELEIESHDQNQ